MENEASLLTELQESLPVKTDGRPTMEELTLRMAEYVNGLIEGDFQQLVSMLYSIDVSESRLRSVLKTHPGEDAGRLIAELIIERQLQKIRTRYQYRSGPADADEEKW
jgi:hypothetical protein